MRTADDLLEGVHDMLDELVDFMCKVQENTKADFREAAEIAVPIATLQLQLAAVLIQRDIAETPKRTLELSEKALAGEA